MSFNHFTNSLTMSNPSLGNIQIVEPRKLWKDEARDFTPWLAEKAEWLIKPTEIKLFATLKTSIKKYCCLSLPGPLFPGKLAFEIAAWPPPYRGYRKNAPNLHARFSPAL